MSSIDPLSFFLWKDPRLLIDLRPADSFVKGSLNHAFSLPIEEQIPNDELYDRLKNLKGDKPLHLIDLKGQLARQIGEKMSIDYLEGGYKTFKKWRENAFSSGPTVYLIGGYTGSGKTLLLQHLQTHGHQVIDLEKMAVHKGSVFGSIPQGGQPLHEHFQNNLLSTWLTLNPALPVFIEEKGPFLGKNGVPRSLYEQMAQAKKIYLNVSFEERLSFILREYSHLKGEKFRKTLRSLEPRMGMSQNHKALHFHDIGQREKCFELLLQYYDKTYENRRKTNWKGNTISIEHSLKDIPTTLAKINSIVDKV